MNAQATFEAALALPQTERARLVELLLDSLGLEEDPMSEEEFAAELQRCSSDVAPGAAERTPWSKLKKEKL